VRKASLLSCCPPLPFAIFLNYSGFSHLLEEPASKDQGTEGEDCTQSSPQEGQVPHLLQEGYLVPAHPQQQGRAPSAQRTEDGGVEANAQEKHRREARDGAEASDIEQATAEKEQHMEDRGPPATEGKLLLLIAMYVQGAKG